MTSNKIIPNTRRIIVSIDKDMKSIPGEFFNSKEGRLYKVSPEEAAWNHCCQALTGDTADGYKGWPGVGPVKANKLLGGCTGYRELWPEVLGAYEKAGLSEEEALVRQGWQEYYK